jgi:hypothetical protein
MSAIDQIVYRARNGSTGTINVVASSLREQAGDDLWLERREARQLRPCQRQ